MISASDYEYLLGKISAHDMLLKALYMEWAIESDKPRAKISKMAESMIKSVREACPPDSFIKERVFERMEIELREFQSFLDTRLLKLGHEL